MATAPDLMRSAPAVQTREMLELDLPMVHANELAGYEFPWSEGIFLDCLRVGYICRVLELGGQVIGHGIVSAGAGEAHLLNVCIHPDFRCRGLGRLLLLHLLDQARSQGARAMFLEVRPSNPGAIRLYQALGFEKIGMRRAYYQAAGGREDACVLRLHLT